MPYREGDKQNLTIGYGHVIKLGEHFETPITKKQAEEIFRKDIQWATDAVNKRLKGVGVKNEDVTQQQFDALVSFTFNAGPEGLQKSELIELLATGSAKEDAVRSRFLKFISPEGSSEPLFGLWRRRMDEIDVWLKGDYRRDYPPRKDFEKYLKSLV